MKPAIVRACGPLNVRDAYVPLGRRRAKRISRWFGGDGKLPKLGHELALRDGLVLANRSRCYDLRGPTDAMEKAVSCLTSQELVERRATLQKRNESRPEKG